MKTVSAPILQVKNLTLRLKRPEAGHLALNTVLDDVSLDVTQGRWLAIVGPNGAGKTSLLRCMAGLAHAYTNKHQQTGSVQFAGQEVGHLAAKQRAQSMSWLSQSERPDIQFNVMDVVNLGRLPWQAGLAALTSSDSARDRKIVQAALAQCDVAHLADKRLRDLSGGELQRVLLARALAVDAPVLLQDEATSHLDIDHQYAWARLMRAQVENRGNSDNREHGKTVVSVLHELPIALMADEVLVLQAGRVLHHGAAEDASTHRAMEVAFGGRIEVVEQRLASLSDSQAAPHYSVRPKY